MKRIITFIFVVGLLVLSLAYVFKEDKVIEKRHLVKMSDEFLNIDVSYPVFEGFTNADRINSLIRENNEMNIKEARAAAEDIKEEPGPSLVRVSLETDYTYFETKRILSLQISTYYYSGGAHPIGWIDSYTLDKNTGEILQLKDLFIDENTSIEYISNRIIDEITKDKDSYYDGYETSIRDLKGEFKYFLEDKSLVVYFDVYELSAYAFGMPEFRFELEEIDEILKTEIYK